MKRRSIMQQRDIKLMAHTILEQGHVENDYIEYKQPVHMPIII